MIDEKKLIESIRQYRSGLKPLYISKLTDSVIEDIIRIINKQSKTGEWIFSSERLPEVPKCNPEFESRTLELYLAALANNKYPFIAFWNGRYFYDDVSSVDVTAWMPLPELDISKEK